MSEVFFYHLQSRPLESALPKLLEKCLERGWRCVVQATSEERVDALDQVLWTYDDASFLPHGTDRQAESERQPILLTSTSANPGGAPIRFLVDQASIEDIGSYQRVIHVFDGSDPDAVKHARESWRNARKGGHEVSYWQQGDDGRWQQR